MPVIVLLAWPVRGTLAWLLAGDGGGGAGAPSAAGGRCAHTGARRRAEPVRRRGVAGLALTLALAAPVLCDRSILAILVRRNDLPGHDCWPPVVHRNDGEGDRDPRGRDPMASTTGVICIATVAAAEWLRCGAGGSRLLVVVTVATRSRPISEGHRRSRPAGTGPPQRRRPVVSERSFIDGGRHVCSDRAARRARRRSPEARAMLAGLAVGLAAAVAQPGAARPALGNGRGGRAGIRVGGRIAAAFGGWLCGWAPRSSRRRRSHATRRSGRRVVRSTRERRPGRVRESARVEGVRLRPAPREDRHLRAPPSSRSHRSSCRKWA
jgi:hypothetical protein